MESEIKIHEEKYMCYVEIEEDKIVLKPDEIERLIPLLQKQLDRINQNVKDNPDDWETVEN